MKDDAAHESDDADGCPYCMMYREKQRTKNPNPEPMLEGLNKSQPNVDGVVKTKIKRINLGNFRASHQRWNFQAFQGQD